MQIPTGAPAWIELLTPDRGRAQIFYGSVFGWTFADTIRQNTIIESRARRDQRDVAAIVPQSTSETSAQWQLSFATDDLPATCERVRSLGGQVFAPSATEVASARRANCADNAGALFRLLATNDHLGFELTHQPETFTWCEYETQSVPGATAFYEALFDWKTEPAPGAPEYTLCAVDGMQVAGIMAMPAHLGAMPPHWLIYFAAINADQTIARVAEHGGAVLVPPTPFGNGRFAVCADPQGAVFGVLEPRP